MLSIHNVASFILGNFPKGRLNVDVFGRMKKWLHLWLPVNPNTSADIMQLGALQGWTQKRSGMLRFVKCVNLLYCPAEAADDLVLSFCLRMRGVSVEPTGQLSLCILPGVEAMREKREGPERVAPSLSIPNVLLVPHVVVGLFLDAASCHKTHTLLAR